MHTGHSLTSTPAGERARRENKEEAFPLALLLTLSWGEKKKVFSLKLQNKKNTLIRFTQSKYNSGVGPFPAFGDDLKVKGILLHSKAEHWVSCPFVQTDQDGKNL